MVFAVKQSAQRTAAASEEAASREMPPTPARRRRRQKQPPQGPGAIDSSAPAATGDAPTTDDIARRAYLLYEARGRTDGHACDDLLQVEREVKKYHVAR